MSTKTEGQRTLLGSDEPNEFPGNTVPDHAVYLTFNSDNDGIRFRNWWRTDGGKAFAAWIDAGNHRQYESGESEPDNG